MKKLLTLVFISIAFIGQQASAQLQKKEVMLGANLGVNSTKAKQSNYTGNVSTSTNLLINPQFGIGLGGNWIIGIEAGYNYGRQKVVNGNPSEQKYSAISGGAFVRKFHPLGSHFGIFGQGGVNYNHGKTEMKYNGQGFINDYNTNGLSVTVRPGAYYRGAKRFIVEAIVGGIGYSHETAKPENGGIKTTSNSLFLNFTNNLGLGFKFVL